MGVLMADRALAVRRRGPGVKDSHGVPVGGAWGPTLGPWPGAAREVGGGWTLRVDPASWPLKAGDLVVDANGGGSWLVRSARLMRNARDPVVDYVRVEAAERIGANTEVAANPEPTTYA